MAREGNATVVHRSDYSPVPFFIDDVRLTFDLDEQKTRVLNVMRVRRNPEVSAQALRLDGEELNLARVMVNGQGTSFRMDNNQLVLENLPEGSEPFELEIFTTCNPSKNTQLSGLYVSQNSFFTQCEAQGFRRITYFLDRPDVMSTYTVTLRADQQRFPVLLSNGNLREQSVLPDGRHQAVWHDPFKKPSYLFALVAGHLVCREQRILDGSGQSRLLQVFVRPGDLDKTEHAMKSLMASIAWDEARFGLPLDLDRFMIVATSDFNMGAMENKGLNIFNTKYVLASPATATDADYANIESVVAHEYFHNWTGNRVTCRDWFQLSLKEGLTVFRDQEFSQDMSGSASARAVKRIEDVRLLRSVQFPEDAGPMAHAVRPDSYLEINNFYTVTIYEKGAEVVRMMQTLVGRAGFAKGMSLYFQRHDGQAVTCDDFVQAIADANPGSALDTHRQAFMNWYSQAGTPLLRLQGHYHPESQRFEVKASQSLGSANRSAAHETPSTHVIPVMLGLLDAQGHELMPTQLKVLTQSEDTWVFEGIAQPPILSALRGFSAPVLLELEQTDAQWRVLMAHDSDPFNRWEAAQRLLGAAARDAIAQGQTQQVLVADLVEGLRSVLRDPELDAAFKDLMLTLPSESLLAEQLDEVDPQQVHAVRESMRLQLALALEPDWEWALTHHVVQGPYTPDAKGSGCRALQALALLNLCLAEATRGQHRWAELAKQRFDQASNMTDRLGALQALLVSDHALATPALQAFHQRFAHEELVVDKWFSLQATTCSKPDAVLDRVRQLMRHPDFNLRNPNRARSLIFGYCQGNPAGFHRRDAAGYVFWSEQVLALDAINPQVAARLARALDRWRKLSPAYRLAAQEALQRVAAHPSLSNDVREIISNALKS